LTEVLGRYERFFTLFRDLRGCVEFFLLQDLVTGECSAVEFFAPFDDFRTSPLPANGDAYRAYQRLASLLRRATSGSLGRADHRRGPANQRLQPTALR
jgi:hypothetical protein